jgi:hypothetical protein
MDGSCCHWHSWRRGSCLAFGITSAQTRGAASDRVPQHPSPSPDGAPAAAPGDAVFACAFVDYGDSAGDRASCAEAEAFAVTEPVTVTLAFAVTEPVTITVADGEPNADANAAGNPNLVTARSRDPAANDISSGHATRKPAGYTAAVGHAFTLPVACAVQLRAIMFLPGSRAGSSLVRGCSSFGGIR